MPVQLKPEDLKELSHLELLAKQVVEGFITGLHKSPFHGFSVEFAEHRIYNPGESTRHIDWKLYGKTDRLYVKRYEEETNLRCQIVIDDSSSMYFPENGLNKITFSIQCAAALIELLRRQRDAVGLTVFSDTVEVHTPAKSTSIHQKLLYTELEKLLVKYKQENSKKTSTVEALHHVAENIHKRSLVILFSDMFDSRLGKENEIFSALQHLRHNMHEVILFHVTDKEKEEEFQFDNRPYRFIDMESGEEVKIHPSEIRESYISSMNDYRKELLLKCRQYRIEFVEADIKNGFRQVLMPYLVKRTKMK
ncbi:MAG TPA: DUF58 domain-containing protein [Bacteroidia bacterium]|nr:DUF58 domain-containing protein [Bacteroidia bacterium]